MTGAKRMSTTLVVLMVAAAALTTTGVLLGMWAEAAVAEALKVTPRWCGTTTAIPGWVLLVSWLRVPVMMAALAATSWSLTLALRDRLKLPAVGATVAVAANTLTTVSLWRAATELSALVDVLALTC